jgi:probable phosphoglycerate mutase
MTTIYLIRHGATVLSREDRFAGSSDVALSEEGIEQAKKLGKRLKHQEISAVYCTAPSARLKQWPSSTA